MNGLYAVLLAALALMPQPQNAGPTIPDVIVHGTLFGVQALVLFVLLASLWPAGTSAIAAWLGATGFGTVLESLQLLQPVRAFEVKDLIANSVGAAVACTAVVVLRKLWGRGQEES